MNEPWRQNTLDEQIEMLEHHRSGGTLEYRTQSQAHLGWQPHLDNMGFNFVGCQYRRRITRQEVYLTLARTGLILTRTAQAESFAKLIVSPERTVIVQKVDDNE